MDISIERLKAYSLGLAETLNNLLKQLDNTAIPLTKTDVKDIIISSASRLFVARRMDNKQIIGMLTLIIFRIPFVKKGLLEDIVVDEKYRGKGIGTKLIATAISQAHKEGVKYLDFTSRPERVTANRLYKRLGFKKRETNVYRLIFDYGEV